jgi:hypothetical protein
VPKVVIPDPISLANSYFNSTHLETLRLPEALRSFLETEFKDLSKFESDVPVELINAAREAMKFIDKTYSELGFPCAGSSSSGPFLHRIL